MIGSHVVWAGWIDGRLYWLRDDCGSGIYAYRDGLWRYSVFMADAKHYGRLHVFAQRSHVPPRLQVWKWIEENLEDRPMER